MQNTSETGLSKCQQYSGAQKGQAFSSGKFTNMKHRMTDITLLH